MSIKNKILIYFVGTTISVVGLLFIVVYILFAQFREEDFQQRQKDKIITTLRFIDEVDKDEFELTEAIDRLTINSFLNEKLLIFDSNKRLIYASLDDVAINYSKELLDNLNEEDIWLELKDGQYDVVAIHFKSRNKSYYGISKALDTFGYSKLTFLRNLLIVSFFIFAFVVSIVSIYQANAITKPFLKFAENLSTYTIGNELESQPIKTDIHEFTFLVDKFKELINKANNAYAFQENSIHHISHQLKTPIAVVISEMERINLRLDETLKDDFNKQIAKVKSLADVINVLLEISKIESGQKLATQKIRIDELFFDCIDEINSLHTDFKFDVTYAPDSPSDEHLLFWGHSVLLKQVFINLLSNCVQYANDKRAEIRFDCTSNVDVKIFVINAGKTIQPDERSMLFSYFFRGKNSDGVAGFGLGLVLAKKIMELHHANIHYQINQDGYNEFVIAFKF